MIRWKRRGGFYVRKTMRTGGAVKCGVQWLRDEDGQPQVRSVYQTTSVFDCQACGREVPEGSRVTATEKRQVRCASCSGIPP